MEELMKDPKSQMFQAHLVWEKLLLSEPHLSEIRLGRTCRVCSVRLHDFLNLSQICLSMRVVSPTLIDV